MRAVVTVIGKDKVGILSKVSAECAKCNANVVEVTQSVLQEMFAMVMMVDLTQLNCDFAQLKQSLGNMGDDMGLSIHVMHEDIFNSMHRI
ncbi:MAG: ACT domain-containing protein [Oscillospiraceae bacterium]